MELVVSHLNRALHNLMETDENVVFLGEDVLDPYGGAFKASRGLSERFGDRVLPMPISEQSIVGMANGLSLAGYKPIVEFMFGDFAFLAFDQIINFAAKSVTMYGRRIPHPLVVRCPVGGHRGYGPTHSQSIQKHLIGVPNLDLYEISAYHDLNDLLPLLFETGNPSVVFENKVLYSGARFDKCGEGDLFTFSYVDLKKSIIRIAPRGSETCDCLILCTGGMVDSAIAAATDLFLEHEIECNILVPWRFFPLEIGQILPFINATRSVVIIEEGTMGGTWGAEVAASLALPNRPIQLVHSKDQVIPSAQHLEKEMLVSAQDIVNSVLASQS